MTATTQQSILKYIHDRGEATPKQLQEQFGLSAVSIHRYLKKLLKEGGVNKFGSSPKVFYRIAFSQYIDATYNVTKNGTVEHSSRTFPRFPTAHAVIIEDFFLQITPSGAIKSGVIGFYDWVEKRKLKLEETAKNYYNTVTKYNSLKNNDGIINALPKLLESFPDSKLKQLFYVDFYSYPIFGKTKLGTLLLHGKQTMDSNLIDQTIQIAYPKIQTIITKYHIDALAFIPPTVPRKIQLMSEFQKLFTDTLPIIQLEKANTTIAIQQKTLKLFDDRVENAQNTLFLSENRKFKNVLIIDDAVGSGATIAVVSEKLLKQKIAQNTFAIAIVGSANSKHFETINEV
jgi:hypothetical protein